MDLSGGSIMEFYQKGGPIMHALLICSLIGLVFIFERAWALYRSKIDTQEFLDRVRTALTKRHNVKEAIAICEEYEGRGLAPHLQDTTFTRGLGFAPHV